MHTMQNRIVNRNSGGYLYCLSNPGIKDDDGNPLYKVGETGRSPEQRATELYNSGVPHPFKVDFAIKLPPSTSRRERQRMERNLHNILEQFQN